MGSGTEHFDVAFMGMHEVAKSSGISLETKALVGRPAPHVVREAAAQGVDLIVMSIHGGDWYERLMSRAEAKWVLAYAPCAVAIVH
ncbi:MAG: universal stress protein [Phycisphaerae bacterium]|nr:universal stress protein [Phycisphaerae bacterium]